MKAKRTMGKRIHELLAQHKVLKMRTLEEWASARDKIVAVLRKEFPTAKSVKRNLTWYKCQFKRTGGKRP